MLSEAAPVMRAFAAQVKEIAGRDAFTEKDALAQLKRAYEGASYKVWWSPWSGRLCCSKLAAY